MQFLSLSHQSNQQELEPIQYNGKRMVISFPKRKWKVLESQLFGTLKEEPTGVPRIARIQTVRFHYSAVNFLVPKYSILR